MVIGKIIGGIASFGVDRVMSIALKAAMPGNTGKFTKLACRVGILVIGAVIGEAVHDQVNDKVEEMKLEAAKHQRPMLEAAKEESE